MAEITAADPAGSAASAHPLDCAEEKCARRAAPGSPNNANIFKKEKAYIFIGLRASLISLMRLPLRSDMPNPPCSGVVLHARHREETPC